MSEKNVGCSSFRWGTGAILLLALALRWPVPTPTWIHFDEIAFIVLPLGFWSGDLNPHYFNYPTFHFYLSSLLYLLYYLATSAESVEQFVAYHLLVDGRDLLALVRGANALLAVATVGAVAFLGRRLYGVREGILAALILATMPLAVRFAHLAIVDTPAVFWAVMALLWAVRARQEGRVRDFLVAGIFTGVAAATKYPAVLVAVPVATAILLDSPWPLRRSIWIGSGAALSFSLATPFVWLDAGQFWSHFADMGRTHLLAESSTEEQAWLYHLRYTLRHGLGIVAAVAVALSLLWSVRQRQWQEFVLLAGVVPLAAVLALAESTFMRYALPLTPLLALLIGRLVGMGWKYPLVGGLVTLTLVAEPLYASLRTRSLLSGQDTRIEAQVWLQTHLPHYQRLIQLPSRCGQIQVLTPERVQVRQTHYLQSYGSEALLRAYALLAQHDGLPPLYLETGVEKMQSTSRDSASAPVVIVHYQHPVCPDEDIPPDFQSLLEGNQRRKVFSPGQVEAAIFDRMDWYFLPIAGFAQVEKTGPVVWIDTLSVRGDSVRIEARSYFEALHWVLRGHQARAEKDWTGALQAYHRALEIAPAPEELVGLEVGRYLYTQMGRTYAQVGQLEQAVRFFEQAIALKPAYREAYNELGVAYASLGELEKAVETWGELVASHPDFAPAYFNLGRALWRLERRQQARAYWQKGVELAPNHPSAGRIQQLEGED